MIIYENIKHFLSFYNNNKSLRQPNFLNIYYWVLNRVKSPSNYMLQMTLAKVYFKNKVQLIRIQSDI